MTDNTDSEALWLLKEKYAGVESRGYFDDLRELAMGVPLAYLIGYVPFLNTKIFLDSHPLIPRTETEFWVEKVFNTLISRSNIDIRALDLCAGSGAIGVALLKAFPNAHVDFAEIDVGHHATIWKNIAENGIDDNRATVFGGNLFEELRLDETHRPRKEYDFIFSNPPYIDPEKKGRVAESVLLHEPHQALFGGTGGMEIITRILQDSRTFLKAGGTLYIEHEPEQTDILRTLAEKYGYIDIHVHEDQYDTERMTELHHEHRS